MNKKFQNEFANHSPSGRKLRSMKSRIIEETTIIQSFTLKNNSITSTATSTQKSTKSSSLVFDYSSSSSESDTKSSESDTKSSESDTKSSESDEKNEENYFNNDEQSYSSYKSVSLLICYILIYFKLIINYQS